MKTRPAKVRLDRFIGYVSIPFRRIKQANYPEIYRQAIHPAPTAVAPSSGRRVYLFREDEDLPELEVRHRRRLEQFGFERQTTETRLREEIQRHIVLADFVVADISDINPNVMLEVGFAQAAWKRIIYLTHRSTKDVPSNLRDLKRLLKYSIDNLDDLRLNLWAKIQELTSDLEQDEKQRFARQHGAEIRYYSERQRMPLEERLRNAREIIQILTTNLTTLSANYREAILEALDRSEREGGRLEVTILTSDPSSAFIKPRAAQLDEDSEGYQSELEGSLRSVAAKLLGRRNCSILTYSDFPVQLWHRIDDTIYIGFPSVIRRSRQNCVFAAPIDIPGIKETFLQHFEKLRKSATPMSLTSIVTH